MKERTKERKKEKKGKVIYLPPLLAFRFFVTKLGTLEIREGIAVVGSSAIDSSFLSFFFCFFDFTSFVDVDVGLGVGVGVDVEASGVSSPNARREKGRKKHPREVISGFSQKKILIKFW